MKKFRIHIRAPRGNYPVKLAIFTVLSTGLFFGCGTKNNNVKPNPHLALQDSVFLAISEPSGLTISPDGQRLWTVSDNTNRVYELTPAGDIVRTLPFSGFDLEGIAYDGRDGGSLRVVEENDMEIVQINLAGYVIERHLIDFEGHGGSGLEGICLSGPENELYVVYEKTPPQLLHLDNNYDVSESWTPDICDDFSGLAPGPAAGQFWIVSDESQEISLFDTTDGLISSYPLPYRKAEGIAVGPAGLIYIVREDTGQLYTYRLAE